MTRAAVCQVYQDRSGAWRFRLVAGNGQKTNYGESYTRKHDAVRAAERQKQLWAKARIEILPAIKARTRRST